MQASGDAEITKLAFEFLILTSARTSKVLGARWDEIDFDNKVWSIPGARMKMGREHRVPLAPRCVEILRRAKELPAGSDFVFPGVLTESLCRIWPFSWSCDGWVSTSPLTASARDWAAECMNFPNDVCEMALTRTIRNKTEAAYRRGDLLERRVPLMEGRAPTCLPIRGRATYLTSGLG